MSQHILEPFDSRYTVTIGWDAPLASFFLIVHDCEVEEETGDPAIVWLGADGIASEPAPERVLAEAANWARVPESVVQLLLQDRQAEGSRLSRPGLPLLLAWESKRR